jgi:hypothetical protein
LPGMTPEWKVTAVTPGQLRLANNQVGAGYTVTYQLPNGTQGQVQIAKADYTKDALTALISADAAQLDEISNLTGG